MLKPATKSPLNVKDKDSHIGFSGKRIAVIPRDSNALKSANHNSAHKLYLRNKRPGIEDKVLENEP